MVQLDLLGDLFSIIGGSIAGIPTLVLMAIPFIIGLIIGWFIKKTLKIAIMAARIAVILVYFGFFGLSSSGPRGESRRPVTKRSVLPWRMSSSGRAGEGLSDS